jgi:hypothetical protein
VRTAGNVAKWREKKVHRKKHTKRERSERQGEKIG